ncbi:MAG: hypothetical protein ACKO1O_11815, partial [Erythrobacter sp.]
MGDTALRSQLRHARSVLALGSACVLTPAVAAPDPARTLPPEWRMESDDDYSFYADYAPPPPVKGLVVHGYVADDSIAVDNGTVLLTAPETCAERVTFRFRRTLPAGLPERTTGEYWFYRSGDQALYLSRRWVYEVDAACQGVAREVSRIVRIVWFNGTVTYIEQQDVGTVVPSTERIKDNETYAIPNWLVTIDDTGLRENQQSTLVRQSP